MSGNNVVTKRVTLLIASVSSFITPFLSSSINIALPSIGAEFGIDVVYLSWLVTSYLLGTAVFLVPFGRIADIYGKKKVFLYGTITFTVGSLMAIFVTSAEVLLLTRVLQGLGSAMVFGTGVAILISVYPLQERGKALGINVAAVYLGLSIGPTVGGFLTHYWGWRSIFLATAALGILVIILVLSKLKGEWIDAPGEKFDLPGSLEVMNERLRWRQNGLEIQVEGPKRVELAQQIAADLTLPDAETNLADQAQVKVPVELEIVKANQQQVDRGSSPWQLDPLQVAFTFVNLQVSPEGITGEPEIQAESFKLITNNGVDAEVEVTDGPTEKVYLKRLVRQDETGIWTVVGYNPR
jgi:multidrug resistance protein